MFPVVTFDVVGLFTVADEVDVVVLGRAVFVEVVVDGLFDVDCVVVVALVVGLVVDVDVLGLTVEEDDVVGRELVVVVGLAVEELPEEGLFTFEELLVLFADEDCVDCAL